LNSRSAIIPALLVAPAAHATLHEPGALIEEAAVVDVTDEGFTAVGGLLPALVPDQIDIPDTSDDGSIYEYSLTGAWAGISITDVAIVPQHGILVLDADLLVWLNDASDRFDLYYEALWVFDDTCHGRVEPFPASVTVDLMLEIVDNGDGTNSLDATVGAMDASYDLQSEDIVMDDCTIGDMETVLNWFGLSLYDLIISFADGAIQDALGDAAGDIEALIEDAFAQATVQEQFEVGDAVVDLLLYPSSVEIVPDGMRLAMDGSMDAGAAHECVAAYDPGGSPMTASDPPDIGVAPSSISPSFHLGLLASDDFINQAMYAFWRGGLLCYTIDENFETFPMSTSILGILDGPNAEGAFDILFPDNDDMAIITRPVQQPMADLAGDHDVNLSVEELGLDFYAEVDHREARVLAIELNADIGADLELDGATGELAVALDLAPENILVGVTAAELTVGVEEQVVENFGALLETIIGAVAGDALSGLTFNLPAMEGMGLTSLDAATAGNSEDWLGMYADLGPVAYEGGCDKDGGCSGDSGCSGGGCSGSGPVRAPWALLALGACLLARRRREDQ